MSDSGSVVTERKPLDIMRYQICLNMTRFIVQESMIVIKTVLFKFS